MADYKSHEAVDVVNCGKYRVVVLQIANEVEDEEIEKAVEGLAKSLAGARWALHTAPVESDVKYVSRISISLEEVAGGNAENEEEESGAV